MCFTGPRLCGGDIRTWELQNSYTSDATIQTFIRKLLPLPFLPGQHITTTFVKLKEKATQGPLSQLCDYIQSTWIDGYCGT